MSKESKELVLKVLDKLIEKINNGELDQWLDTLMADLDRLERQYTEEK